MRPIGVAVVGAGYWGRKLTREYLSAQCKGNLSLAGVCDSSPSQLLFCKEKFSISEKLLKRRFEDVIEDSEVSAVHIATPNDTHYTLARMALEAGKDVLVEKPMTLSSREAYDLVDLAASSELVLHVGHIFRFNSAVRAAREILNRGAIGKVFYARVQWTDYCPRFPDRDIVFDLGPHPVDVLNYLLGFWPSQVSGFARGYRNSKTHEEVAYGLAEYADGVFAHIELSWLHPGKAREASIMGSEGALVIDCLNQRVVLHTQALTEVPVSVNNTIEAEIDWFVDSVRRRSLSAESGIIGARTVEVLETLRRSTWEGTVSISVPVEHDHTAAMVGILQRVRGGRSHNAFTNHHLGNTGSKAYLETMVRLGLLETTPTEYRITKKGVHFLREYGHFEHGPKKDLLKAHQKAPGNSM